MNEKVAGIAQWGTVAANRGHNLGHSGATRISSGRIAHGNCGGPR